MTSGTYLSLLPLFAVRSFHSFRGVSPPRRHRQHLPVRHQRLSRLAHFPNLFHVNAPDETSSAVDSSALSRASIQQPFTAFIPSIFLRHSTRPSPPQTLSPHPPHSKLF